MDHRYFDVDAFIDEVEVRPAIWNMHVAEYTNRLAKQQAWDELAMIFCDPNDTDQNLRELGLRLQKKWKTLRDSYTREEKKLKNLKPESEGSPKISFRNYERLKFLQNGVKRNDSESANEMSPKVNDQLNNVKSLNEDRMNKLKFDPTDEYFMKILEKKSEIKKSMENKLDELDEDKLFCLTLSRELKKVPEKKRLKLKIEIYNLILRSQNSEAQQNLKSSSFEPQTNVPINTGKRKKVGLQKDVGNKRLQSNNSIKIASMADSSTGTCTAMTEPILFRRNVIQKGDVMKGFEGQKFKESESLTEFTQMSFKNNPESSCIVPIEFDDSCAEIKKESVDEEYSDESL